MNGYTISEQKCAVVDIDQAMYDFINYIHDDSMFSGGDDYYDCYAKYPLDLDVMALYIALGDLFNEELMDNPQYVAWRGMIEALQAVGYSYALLRYTEEVKAESVGEAEEVPF